MSVHHRRACSQARAISFGRLVLGRIQQPCVRMQLRGSDGVHVYSAGPCALTWSGCSTRKLGALLLLHDTLRLALEEYPQRNLGSRDDDCGPFLAVALGPVC